MGYVQITQRRSIKLTVEIEKKILKYQPKNPKLWTIFLDMVVKAADSRKCVSKKLYFVTSTSHTEIRHTFQAWDRIQLPNIVLRLPYTEYHLKKNLRYNTAIY
jgi:hypothetical protein